MIKVPKRSTLPKLLRDEGHRLTKELCDLYALAPKTYRSGKQGFSFSQRGYGHASIKQVIKADQNEKCCYCESRFTSTSAGDIEHFRPKGYCQQNKGGCKVYPGYFWLAYDWSNLFYSCDICNRTYKRNLFPLSDESRRALDFNADITREQPLLLSPLEDVHEHIGFHQEVPVPLTERGQVTIDCIGLDRSALDENRRTTLAELRRTVETIILLSGDERAEAESLVTEARSLLREAIRTTAVFSAMARSFLLSYQHLFADPT